MTTPERLKSWACFGGRVEVWRHTSSACGGLPMEFSVYIPAAAMQGSVPVVTYLSGLTCTWENATTKAGAQRVAAELGLSLIFPDTSPRGAGIDGEDDGWDFGTGAGFYLDATVAPWSAHYRMNSYVTTELPALVAELYPALDFDRHGLTGHSMGGHGALVLGLTRPDLYRSISAFSPICAPTEVPWGEKAFSGYLGPDRAAWAAHDACALLNAGHARADVNILVDQGLDDSFREEQLKPGRLKATCEAVGQPLTLREHPGYDHSYYFISTFIEDHLRHHAAALA